MKKKQFLERLEQLLAGLPQEEREEAMSWYRDYLDDAGEEQEAEVIARLGSPEDVANSILANLKGNEPGGFTETGYESFPQRKVPAKQEDVKRDRRTAYDGPYEYIPRQERQSGTQQPSGGRQYSDAQRQGGPQAGTADPRGPQADQARRQGGASAGRRTGSGTGRPAWVTVLLTLAGVAVIVILAIIFCMFGIGGLICVWTGMALLAFGFPAGGVAVAGIGLILVAVFVAGLVLEIVFCRRVMPELMGSRRRGRA